MLALMIIAHVFVNIYWLHADNHLVHLDEAHHMDRAVAYHDALFPEDAETALFGRFVAALGVESPYPPLFHVAGALVIRLLGRSSESIALTGTFAFALLLWGVYMLARQGMTPRNAFLTACVTGLTPMLYAGSRYFMPDILLGALTAWALFALMKSDCFRAPGWVAAFAIFTGLALLTSQRAFVYLLPPTLFIIGCGLAGAARGGRNAPAGTRRKRMARIVLHAVMCVCIVAGACSWWYVRHVEYLHVWWSTQRGGDAGILQPGVGARLDAVMPEVTDRPGTRIALDPLIAASPDGVHGDRGERSGAPLVAPLQRYWDVYPLYLVNETLFLPLALVAAAGLLAMPLKRNRMLLTPLMLVWLCGAWLLLTALFTLRSPRFLYAAAPPAAFFCVLALDAIGRKRLRRAAWCLLFAVLGVSFINLSFLPLGPLRRVELPLLRAHPAVAARGNRGLAVYKDHINAGHYQPQPPIRGESIAETILASMAAYEARRTQPEGAAAWYQVVASTPAHLGLPFYARHHTPPPLAEGVAAARPFAAVKWESRQPEDTQPELAETEYVVLKPDMTGDYIRRLEDWASFFMPYGFESILNTWFEGYGPAAPGYVHVMARKEVPSLDQVRNLFDLYDLLERDGRDWLLSDEERMDAEQRYARQVSQYDDARPLGGGAALLGFHVRRRAEDWFTLQLIVHVRETREQPLRVWLRATPHAEDRSRLMAPQQALAELVWDFDPHPPTTQWQPNQALVLSRPIMTKPLRYQLDIGLFDPEQQERPDTMVETEWVSFADSAAP